jgi:hypothetical protein
MKNKTKIPHCPNISKSNGKIVEKGKMDSLSTQIHDRWLVRALQ